VEKSTKANPGMRRGANEHPVHFRAPRPRSPTRTSGAEQDGVSAVCGACAAAGAAAAETIATDKAMTRAWNERRNMIGLLVDHPPHNRPGLLLAGTARGNRVEQLRRERVVRRDLMQLSRGGLDR